MAMAERIEIPDAFPEPGDVERPARGDHRRGPWPRRGDRPRLLAAPARRWRWSSRTERDLKAVADELPGRDARVQRRRPRRRLQRGRRRRHRRRVGWRRRLDLQRRHLPDRRRPAGIEPEVWRDVIDVNLTGAFLGARAAARVMGDGGRADLHRLGPRRTAAQGTDAVQRVEGGAHRDGQGAGPRPRTGRASPSTSCRPAGSSRRSPTGSPTTSGWPSRSSSTRRCAAGAGRPTSTGAYPVPRLGRGGVRHRRGHHRRRRIPARMSDDDSDTLGE